MAYNTSMERVLDKLILLALAVLATAWQPFALPPLAIGLAAVSLSALFEVDSLPRPLRTALVGGFLLAGLVGLALPAQPDVALAYLAFLPLIAYDCFRLPSLWPALGPEAGLLLSLSWVAPLLAGMMAAPPEAVLLAGTIGALACCKAWQGGILAGTLADYRRRRDELAALSRSLELRNRGLEERQELQMRLATLDERSRIAREIHDNVGHLLTRAVLMVEALQVQHGGEPGLSGQLDAVAGGLHEAYESLRQSVHGLHEEAFELRTQLLALARETEEVGRADGLATGGSALAGGSAPGSGLPRVGAASGQAGLAALPRLQVELEYGLADDGPLPAVGYSLLAIVKEALANSLKHSDASHVLVSLKEFPGLYQLTVLDNGSQPPPPDASRGGGIGLASMEERARALGGVLRTSYEGGFKVFASIPKGA